MFFIHIGTYKPIFVGVMLYISMADDNLSQDDRKQSHKNVTELDEHGNPAQHGHAAALATLSQEEGLAIASECNANARRQLYQFSIDDAERYFIDNGYEVATRTISNYCLQNQFQCKKFTSNGVRRYFIQKQSLDAHLEQMRHDGHAIASNRIREHTYTKDKEQKDISSSQDDRKRSHATASDEEDGYREKYIKHLEEENDFLRGKLNDSEKHTTALEEIAKGLGGLLAEPRPKPTTGEGAPDEESPPS